VKVQQNKPFKVNGTPYPGMRMELKYIASAALGISGGIIALRGFLTANPARVNLGVAGLFLSAIVLTLKSSKYVKKDAMDIMLKSYKGFLKNLLNNLKLEGKAVYIPPYKNLPKGGIFVPLYEEFDIDTARLDEGIFFLTDVPSEKSMGILITSLGTNLLEKYEEQLEAPLTSISAVESSAGSVLKALGLAKRVYIEEDGENIRIIVSPEILCDSEECEKIPCPICASILLGLAKATGNLLSVESFEKKDYGIEIRVKKLGGVKKWM
jgi:hypothetical protein